MDSWVRTTERLISQGNISAARALLAAARAEGRERNIPNHIPAQIEIAAANWPKAIEILNESLSRDPNNITLHILLAHCHLAEGEVGQAVLDAANAVTLDPQDGKAQTMLGFSLARAGMMVDAAICLKEGIKNRSTDPMSFLILSEVEEKLGRTEDARRVLEEGIEALPAFIELRNAATLLAIRMNEFEEAFEISELARKEGVVDATLFGLRGHALSNLGRREEAGLAYQEALKLGPNDPYVRHLVASFGAVPGAVRASNEYIRVVFDGYASRFDQHLIGLGYRVPGLVRSAILRQFSTGGRTGLPASLLDLGCGTGLVGVAISDLPIGRMEGVDLSPKMLEEAQSKGIYHALHLREVCEFLEETDVRFEAIIAADVMCYFGDIRPILNGVRNRLAEGGSFFFSVEKLDRSESKSGWVLGPAGRYSHSISYIWAAVEDAGLEIVDFQDETLRREGGMPVAGMLGVLQNRGGR